MNVGVNMAPQWHRTARLVIPAGFVEFGIFLFIFSCIYCFGAVGFQTTTFMNSLKQCKRHSTLPRCNWLAAEMAGGIIGLLFGLGQIGIGAVIFTTKEKSQLFKIWAVVNSILLTFILSAGILPLHVYSLFPCKIRGPAPDIDRQYSSTVPECTAQQSYTDKTCYRHFGCNQLSIADANGIILCYGILGIMDAIFIFASVVVMAVMHQAAADSPDGYYPPGSAIQPIPSNQSQTGSMAQMPQSQADHPKDVPNY